MNIRWVLPFLALLCVGWADSWEQLATTAGGITSVQAEFVQEKNLPILAKPLVSKGVFYYQAPRSMRWEYQWPVRSILTVHEGLERRFVASGQDGFHQEGGAGLKVIQVVVEEITQWFAGRFDNNPMFQAHLDPGKLIVLVPKDSSLQKMIQRIVLKLGSQPGIIESVTIYESENAFTKLTFKNTVLNARIENSIFQETP